MAHYFADIKAGIVSVLQASTKVKNIYNFEQTKPGGYPAITVTSLEGNAEFLDTQRVRRDFSFSVKCYQERVEVGASEAERILTALVDEVVGIFDNFANTTLNNTVVYMKPVSMKWGYLNVPDADIRSCDITLIGEAAQ